MQGSSGPELVPRRLGDFLGHNPYLRRSSRDTQWRLRRNRRIVLTTACLLLVYWVIYRLVFM